MIIEMGAIVDDDLKGIHAWDDEFGDAKGVDVVFVTLFIDES